MGNDKMSKLRFVTATFGVSLFALASIAFAQDGGDPALAPANAASASLQATTPSAPGTAASAASEPASSASTGQPVSISAVREQEAMSTSEFFGFAFATRDAAGFGFDSNLELQVDRKMWPYRTSTEYLQHFRSKDKDSEMTLDFGGRPDGGYEIITTSKVTNRATMTVFLNKKPVSYTIVGKHGAYTATEKFCRALKAQTKSKSFEDLAAKANACSDLYATAESTVGGLDEHIKTHRENIARMQKSPAKSIVDEERANYLTSESRKNKRLAWETMSASRIATAIWSPNTPVKPRAILNRSSSVEDANDRKAVLDMAEACGRLWKDDATATAQPANPTRPAAVKK